MEQFNILYSKNGVHFLTEPELDFERHYLEARKREGWLYSDDHLKTLPDTQKNDPHVTIWKQRKQSLNRFLNYLAGMQQTPRNILEIGCGNGWFSQKLTEGIGAAKVFAIDINLYELQQAARVFGEQNPVWLYGDIVKTSLPRLFFDLIVFNAALHYFPDLPLLFNHIHPALMQDGEIHIFDSPFYSAEKQKDAKKRIESYYLKLGVKAMAAYYHAHSTETLVPYNLQLLYDPGTRPNRLKRMAGIDINPMPWIRLRP